MTGFGDRLAHPMNAAHPGDPSNIATLEAEPVPAEVRCVLAHKEPQKREFGLLCKRHYHWLNNVLDEVTRLYPMLAEVVIPGAAGGDGRRGTSVDAPAPGRLEVIAITEITERGGAPRDAGDELWYEAPDIPALVPSLMSWAALVLEERRINPPDWQPVPSLAPACASCLHPTCVYARGVSVAVGPYVLHATRFGVRWEIRNDLVNVVGILRGQRHWIAAQLWVDEYAAELATLHRAVARSVGDSMWPKPIGRCPNCQTPLYNTVGVDEVTCRKCRTAWSGVHLARLRLIFEQEQQARGAGT